MSNYVQLTCAACSVGFSKLATELARSERHNGVPVKYCSRACAGIGRKESTLSKRASSHVKTCASCNQELAIDQFSMKTSATGLRQNSCKSCTKESLKRRRDADPEKTRAQLRASYMKHRDRRVSEMREAYQVNAAAINQKRRGMRPLRRDALNEQNKLWRLANPDLVRAIGAEKRASRRLRTAGWDRELTLLVTREAARLAVARERLTGVPWHIDHEVPLQGESVCGLHVWSNLAVVPAAFNLSKGNKFDGQVLARSWL
jgi:hypothetical protein